MSAPNSVTTTVSTASNNHTMIHHDANRTHNKQCIISLARHMQTVFHISEASKDVHSRYFPVAVRTRKHSSSKSLVSHELLTKSIHQQLHLSESVDDSSTSNNSQPKLYSFLRRSSSASSSSPRSPMGDSSPKLSSSPLSFYSRGGHKVVRSSLAAASSIDMHRSISDLQEETSRSNLSKSWGGNQSSNILLSAAISMDTSKLDMYSEQRKHSSSVMTPPRPSLLSPIVQKSFRSSSYTPEPQLLRQLVHEETSTTLLGTSSTDDFDLGALVQDYSHSDDEDDADESLEEKPHTNFEWLGGESVNTTRKLHNLILENRKQAYNTGYSHDEYEKVLFEHFKNLFEDAVSAHLDKVTTNGIVDSFIDLSTTFLDSSHKNCTLLHSAARSEALLIITYLADNWLADVNAQDKTDSTPLYYACSSDCPKACLLLLSKGAKPNIRDNYDNFPLLIAIRNGNFECADNLLLCGADITFTGKKGTCLHSMCEAGDIEKIDYLIDAAPTNQSIIFTCKNRQGQTPLFSALSHPNVVDLLLRRMRIESERVGGEDTFFKWIKSTDEMRQSVFHVCCQHGYQQSLWKIISFCSSDTLKEAFAEQDSLTKATPLHLAVTAQQYDIAKLLTISTQVDLNIKNDNGDTPLHLALTLSDEAMSNDYVDMFINLGNPDTTIKNAKGLTANKIAKKKGTILTRKNEPVVEQTSTRKKLFQNLLQKPKSEKRASTKINLEELNAKQSWNKNKSIVESRFSKIYYQNATDDLEEVQSYELIQWNDYMSVGIGLLDDQNRKLIDMTNRLYIITTERHIITERQSTAYIVGSLIEYAHTQFNNEIRQMNYHFRNCNERMRKELQQHEMDHDRFKGALRIFQQRLEQSDNFIELDLLNVITVFILEHVIKKDKPLFLDIAEKMRKNLEFL